jgi:multicomponent Na+:H+ antiporter subunit D
MISLYLYILIPIVLSVIIYLSVNKYVKLFVIAMQGMIFFTAVIQFLHVKNIGTVVETIGGWEPVVGITLRADLLSSVLVMLTTLLFLCLLVYNYPKEYVNNLFLFLFIILQALLTGIFLSNDLFNIFVLIEVSTIVVSIMIMFKKDSRSIYDGILYLLVNIVAMAFFLFGTGFLYKSFGVLDISAISERMMLLDNHSRLILPYALLITAVSLKAALMPLFSWLPKAHATPGAPTIVSAVLSGLYVKAGIYLFIRINGMFSPYIDTSTFFMIMGFLTGAAGFILAFSQTNIKLLLAYSTISQIGLIMVGLNLDHSTAFWGSVYHIVNHSFFKSTLFLTAGVIIEEYNTKDLRKMRGVFQRMPYVSIACFLAMLGVTGAPLFNGSISKYLIYTGTSGRLFEYALLLINLGTIAYFMKFLRIFSGERNKTKAKVHPCRTAVVLLLGSMCFVGGIFGKRILEFLFNLQIEIDWTSYVQKALLYLVMLGVGWLVYRIFVLKPRLLNKVRELDLCFNDICLSIAIFFFVTLFYLAIKYSVFPGLFENR